MAAQAWDLGGRLVVRAEGLGEVQLRAVTSELDPFAPAEAAEAADVVLAPLDAPELVELHGPANDDTTTGVDREGRLLVRHGGRWTTVPAPGDVPVRIGFEPGLAPATCWGSLVRPAMHQALHAHGAAAVHAAAVDDGAEATLVTGWSESGKTEVALALVEAGQAFLSDTWTVAGEDGGISAFPVGVGVRGWVLEALPRLRASLPGSARAQLAAAKAIGTAARPAIERGARGRVSGLATTLVGRAVDLGDRAGLSPSALREAYGQTDDPARRLRLGTVVVLVTGEDERVEVEDVDAAWAARRLARTAAYERRAYFDLQERGAYAGLGGRAGARDAAVAREQDLLLAAFAHARRVVRVRCPFPGDPRRVADALA